VKKEASLAPAGEVRHKVWAEAHQGVDEKVVEKRKTGNQCLRCGMRNQTWKYCRKPIQVSAVYRGQSKPKGQSAFAPNRYPHVATVAIEGKGERSKCVVPRPPAGAYDDDDIL